MQLGYVCSSGKVVGGSQGCKPGSLEFAGHETDDTVRRPRVAGHRKILVLFLAVALCCLWTFSGCGGVAVNSGTTTSQLRISDSTIDFGSVALNTTSTKSLTLVSAGTAAVTVNSVTLAGTGFAVSGISFPATLIPGQTVTVQVGFNPTVAGLATGTISISTDSNVGTTSKVTLTGTGAPAPTPQLTLSARSLDFGNISLNTASAQTLTLTSSGNAALTVNSVAFTGAGFAISGATFPATLNPGESLPLQLSFDPTVMGAAIGTITISSNSASESTSTVNLTGTGMAAQLALSAATLDFGDVNLNTTSANNLSLTSSGNTPLTVNAVTLTGATFSISGANFPATLNPGQSLTLQVSFDPTAAGDATGIMSIASNSVSGSKSTVNLRGSGKSPQLTVNASSLDFGNVNLNTTATKALTLISSGNTALTVNAVAVSGAGFAISGSTFPAKLNPGQSLTLQASFDPTVAGAATGNVTISSNSSTGKTSTISLTGTGMAGQLSVSATALDFGSVSLNTTLSKTLTLTSSGNAAVTVNPVTLTGAAFAVSGATFPATLNPGQSLSLQVSFDPIATGTASGTITISSNASSGGTATVALSGTGTSPQLTISGTMAFGNVVLNSTSTQTLTLTSSGTAPVTVNSATLAGTGFSMSGATLPTTLNPGQTLTLQVNFNPTTAGSASGTITISSNSFSGGTATVSLSGTGTSPQLTISGSTIAFGNVVLNSASTKTLTLTSSGTAAVTVNSVTLTGTGFSMTGATFPTTLSPGQTLTLQVTFSPTAPGSASGTITISSNSSTGGSSTVALSGTGTTNPVLTLSANTLSFGDDLIGAPATLSVTLSSTGTTPVTISAASLTGAGFTFSGATFPVTLNPTIAITIQVQFNPTVVGAASGALTFTSNSTSGSTSVVSLTGNGTPVQHHVNLSWAAPVSSPVQVTGYNIYRASGSSSSFQLLNSSSSTSYLDLQVVSGTAYSYYVTSTDSAGTESVASNQITVTIP